MAKCTCVFKGWRMPDGTLQPDPPPEALEKILDAFASVLGLTRTDKKGET